MPYQKHQVSLNHGVSLPMPLETKWETYFKGSKHPRRVSPETASNARITESNDGCYHSYNQSVKTHA